MGWKKIWKIRGDERKKGGRGERGRERVKVSVTVTNRNTSRFSRAY